MEYVTLNNGIKMPKLRYGVYQTPPESTKRCVLDAIGVSSFGPDRYPDIQHFSEIKPAVDRIETPVFRQQKVAKEYLKRYSCRIESWGPFAEGKKDMFTNPVLTEIGKKYGKAAVPITRSRTDCADRGACPGISETEICAPANTRHGVCGGVFHRCVLS